MPDDIHDRDLLEALRAMAPVALRREVWRVTPAGTDPCAGMTDGGRWHPPDRFEALYTSLDKDGAIAEIYHHLSGAPVLSSCHSELNRLAVRTERTLILTEFGCLERLGVVESRFRAGDYARTRDIGAAARLLGVDALIVPCAQWPCTDLVIFPDRLSDPAAVTVAASDDVNWPAWKEQVSGRPGEDA